MILAGTPGIGKSSLAAQTPGVVFMTDESERGIETLKESGQVPDVPVMPPCASWSDVFEVLEALRTGEHSYRALAVDAMGGFETLCHAEVCRRDFNGDRGKSGFLNYQNGYDVSVGDWRQFLSALDKLRDERRMSIMLLGHVKIKNFKNPAGPDYDRFIVDVHEKTWSATHKWADIVIFANYDLAFLDETKGKAKAKGGQTRTMHTQYSASWEAKNRHGLPPEISMGDSAAEAWANFTKAMADARKANKAA